MCIEGALVSKSCDIALKIKTAKFEERNCKSSKSFQADNMLLLQ